MRQRCEEAQASVLGRLEGVLRKAQSRRKRGTMGHGVLRICTGLSARLQGWVSDVVTRCRGQRRRWGPHRGEIYRRKDGSSAIQFNRMAWRFSDLHDVPASSAHTNRLSPTLGRGTPDGSGRFQRETRVTRTGRSAVKSKQCLGLEIQSAEAQNVLLPKAGRGHRVDTRAMRILPME